MPKSVMALVATTLLALVVGGCSFDDPPDVESGRNFERFPIYWLGETFEGLDVSVIDGIFDGTERVSIIYGSCKPSGTFEPSCQPPVSIQMTRLCFHIDAVALPPKERTRRIRGAPVGTQDGAPVLLTRRTQIKVYRGEGTDPRIALRALRALRSLNTVRPVITQTGPIPPPPPGVLEGNRACTDY